MMNEQSDLSILKLERNFNVSATTLYDAWIFAPVAESWLFKNDTNELNFEADLQEGKKFSILEIDQGNEIDHFGTFINISRPYKLIFSLTVPSHFDGTSEVEIEINEGPAGSELIFIQKNIDTSKTKAAWEKMLGRLDGILRDPYIITPASDIETLLIAINIIAMQLAGFIRSLDEIVINEVPYNKSWTAAQLLRHIIKSTREIAKALNMPGTDERDPTEQIVGLKQAFLDITNTFQSPLQIVPEEEHYEKNRLLSDFRDAFKKLNTAAKKCNTSEIVKGLPLGPVSKLEMLHFVLYHSQRHLNQMRKISDILASK